MLDCFDGLRHHPIVRGNNQDDYIRNIRAPRPHGAKGGVTGCIQKSDPLAISQANLIGPNVLSNSAVFSSSDIRRTQGIQKTGLAVIDVPHNCDDGRANNQVVI